MANKPYGLYVSVGMYDKDPDIPTPVRHFTLEIERFGIRKGQELTVDEIYEKGVGTMGAMFKSMKRPSPVSLLWAPPNGQQLLFNDLKKSKLQIRVTFVRSGNHSDNPNAATLMTIDNVHIRSIKPELAHGNGGHKKFERIDAVFSKFEY
jgi:hypothetical protein